MDALNPNHPVTQEMSLVWHKVAALVMHKCGVQKVAITSDDIEAFSAQNMCIVAHPADRVLTISLVTMAEGERLAREAGGLPQ